MPRRANRNGGGNSANLHGLHFEQTTCLDDVLQANGYLVNEKHQVILSSNIIGLSVNKRKFYKYFLEINNINYLDFNSKRWEPDECFVNFSKKTVFIIEKKFQNTSGSVDEKIPNCDFKKKEYQKLCNPIHYHVEFIYVFSDWFKNERYTDFLTYIKDVGCKYFFNDIPLNVLGLSDN